MPGTPTPRRGIPTLDAVTRADTPDVPRDINAMALSLDNAPIDAWGLASARPANPGKDGYWYFATDTSVFSRYRVGAGWADVNPKDAAAATASLRTLGVGANQAAAGNDGRFTDQRTPSNGSVTLAKMAAGVGGRVLALINLGGFDIGANTTVQIGSQSVTHNGKGGFWAVFHSVHNYGGAGAGGGGIIVRRGGTALATASVGALVAGRVGSAMMAGTYGALSGAQTWSADATLGNVPTTISGNSGLLAIIETY